MSSPAKPKAGQASRRQRRTPKPSHRPKAEPNPTLRVLWWFPLALLAWGLLIYLPALGGQFVFDDLDLKETASTVRTGRLQAIIGSGRPVLMASYVLSHRLGGFQPFPFHLTNVLLHCLNAMFLWGFLLALFKTGALDDLVPERYRAFLVYGIPALFLTSPIQTESVAYISSRSGVLSTMFVLLALWAFVSPMRQHSPWNTAFLVCFLFGCSVGSKQNGMVLPAVILVMDYLLLARCDWRRLRDNWPTYALFVAAGIAGFFIVIKPFLMAPSAGFRLDWHSYLFTQFRMYFLYFRLILVPFGLNADYDITPSMSLWEHWSWLALLLLLAGVGAVLYHHKRFPLVAFGVLLFFGTLAPTSSFFPFLDYAAERHLYLPMLGLLIAGTAAIARYWQPNLHAAYAVLIAIVAVYSVGTCQRSTIWADSVALWTDTVKKSPGKARPWVWLGKVYNDRLAALRAELSVEGRPPSRRIAPPTRLMALLEAQARGAWEKAEEVVEPNSAEHAHLLNNLGLSAANRKDYAQAVKYYERAVGMRRGVPLFWANLAVAQLRLGREEEAWPNFDRAAARARNHPEVFQLRGQEYFQKGRYREAVADFRRQVQMTPEDPVALRNLEAAEQMLLQPPP